MSRVLVVGASGLVGNQLLTCYRNRGYHVLGTAYSQQNDKLIFLDLANASAVKTLIQQFRPSRIAVPAAFTNVDECERSPESGRRVNVEGLANLVDAVVGTKAQLTFYSTDYVFDGVSGPYGEDDTPHPLNEYGRQKLWGEQLLQSRLPGQHLIIRTTWVYGCETRPRNFVARLVLKLAQGEGLAVPVDQYGSPTYAPDLAAAACALEDAACSGIYHVAGTDWLSRFHFARLAAELFGYPADMVKPASTSDLGQPARRPLQSGLKTAKSSARFPGLLSATAGLLQMKRALGLD